MLTTVIFVICSGHSGVNTSLAQLDIISKGLRRSPITTFTTPLFLLSQDEPDNDVNHPVISVISEGARSRR